VDLACFKGWGDHATGVAWPDYYDYFSAYLHPRQHNTETAKWWCDYPPVYIMILAFLSAIRNFLSLSQQIYTVLIKLPNIICDIIVCSSSSGSPQKLSDSNAMGLSLLYAFNPAIIINSAVWGQADALYTLLALLIVEFVLSDKMWLSGVVLASRSSSNTNRVRSLRASLRPFGKKEHIEVGHDSRCRPRDIHHPHTSLRDQA